MASHDIEKDIADPNDRSSSKEGEKPELANIEDLERQKEQVEARLSRFTKEEEEAVIRKLDWHLMPLIFVLYSLSVLDRSNLGNAKIAGMQKDINISGNRYAWLGTIFYISCKSPCLQICFI
jgi:CCR4-NOT transcriptional regulation complex NOT5 subunit